MIWTYTKIEKGVYRKPNYNQFCATNTSLPLKHDSELLVLSILFANLSRNVNLNNNFVRSNGYVRGFSRFLDN